MHEHSFREITGRIIARAWADPGYREKLIADPHSTLTEAGVRIPKGIRVVVVSDTPEHRRDGAREQPSSRARYRWAAVDPLAAVRPSVRADRFVSGPGRRL